MKSSTGKRIAVVITAAVILVVLGAIVLGYGMGLAGYRHHGGYLAPVWMDDGNGIYYFERQTSGWVIGPGREFFTPPAKVLVDSDRVTLNLFRPASGEHVTLHAIELTPHLNRWVSRYHGRIFGSLSSVIQPHAAGANFRLKLSMPSQPYSETWLYQGALHTDRVEAEGWIEGGAAGFGQPEDVLGSNGELMLIRDDEGFGMAVLSVHQDFTFDVLVAQKDFNVQLVDIERLRQNSRRSDIERIRHQRRIRGELIAEFKAEGMSAGSASLAAIDEMEEMGVIPKSPRLVGEKLTTSVPAGVPVFDIPPLYYDVGMFVDLAAAMGSPGQEVKTSTGTYLKYANDDVGVRLKKYRQDHDVFFVRSDGETWHFRVVK